MRYSFYQSFNEKVNVFRLYIQMPNGSVRNYEFASNIKAISNEDGITRLFGKEVSDVAGNYFLFPLQFDNVDVGEFMFIEENEKFVRLRFLENDKPLQGDWILRTLSNGDVLFWKPFPVVSVMPTKDVQVFKENGEELPVIEQRFSVFGVITEGTNFEGIAAAEGVWTGADFHTTLFTDKIIESLAQQMRDTMEIQLIDYNHDFISSGALSEVELREERGIKYIYVKGVGDKPIPFGSGLSILIKSTLKWDNNLNVFVLLSAEPKGVSIITENIPACTICMIR